MKRIVFIILYFLSAQVSAGKADEVISALGVSKDDFKLIFLGGRCESDWSATVDKSDFKDESALGYIGVTSKYFVSKEIDGKIVLSPGKKCLAISDYYFNQVESKVIEEFIKKDIDFSKKYGFSFLDALFIERTQNFSWNGEVSGFNRKHAESLKKKGLFIITEQSSTFNGKSSKVYSGKITPIGEAFYDQIFQEAELT